MQGAPSARCPAVSEQALDPPHTRVLASDQAVVRVSPGEALSGSSEVIVVEHVE